VGSWVLLGETTFQKGENPIFLLISGVYESFIYVKISNVGILDKLMF
jgi:hypothetical protein